MHLRRETKDYRMRTEFIRTHRGCRGLTKPLFARISVYVYQHGARTRRQINRTVNTAALSLRRKCIIMHCETCTRFQSAGVNLWRIEIAFDQRDGRRETGERGREGGGGGDGGGSELIFARTAGVKLALT